MARRPAWMDSGVRWYRARIFRADLILVNRGSGLAKLGAMGRKLSTLIPSGVSHYPLAVSSFSPTTNSLSTPTSTITYDYLVVAPGLQSNFSAIPGLLEGLKDPEGPVSSIYQYASVEKAWKNIKEFKKGKAIFTQPAGIIKCAGAPQKVRFARLYLWSWVGS